MVLHFHCVILLDSGGGLAKLWLKNDQQIIFVGNQFKLIQIREKDDLF